jgi:hypothetical protein
MLLMSKSILVFFACIVISIVAHAQQATICNPINLSYRFCLDTPSRREAADPTMVVYKGVIRENYLLLQENPATSGMWQASTERTRKNT